MSELVVSTAIGGFWERIGTLIRATGSEDSSGFRRMVMDDLRDEEYSHVARALQITEDEAKALRDEPK